MGLVTRVPVPELLFLGPSYVERRHRHDLLRLGVTHIVNATVELPFSHPAYFEFYRVAVSEDQTGKLAPFFNQVSAHMKRVLEEPGNGIFVHCVAGAARSASVVLAYLIYRHKMSLREAFELLRGARRQVRPSSHFMSELIQWDFQCNGSCDLTIEEYEAWHSVERLVVEFPEHSRSTVVRCLVEDEKLRLREAALSLRKLARIMEDQARQAKEDEEERLEEERKLQERRAAREEMYRTGNWDALKKEQEKTQGTKPNLFW